MAYALGKRHTLRSPLRPNRAFVVALPVFRQLIKQIYLMPTPFTHLAIANRLLEDASLSETARALLHAQRPAFLLGSVAADARISPTSQREDTHFYHYTQRIQDHPWRVMLARYPSLATPRDDAHRAFVAGYVAHLATDEYWSLHMLEPHFARGTWGDSIQARFFVLHLLLIAMDERDLAAIDRQQAHTLAACQPHNWLPFMPDEVLCEWNAFIAQQLLGESETLRIFGERVRHTPAELRALLDDPAYMQNALWQHITPDLLTSHEAGMYAFSLAQLEAYLAETAR